MPKRRHFLGAIMGSTAVAALTAVAPPPTATGPTQVIVKETFVWPDDLPKLTSRPAIPESEQLRLVKELLAAERELITLPNYQYVGWNGFEFHLPSGPSVVPSQIAYSYRLAEQDKHDNAQALFGKLQKKYSHTYRGSV